MKKLFLLFLQVLSILTLLSCNNNDKTISTTNSTSYNLDSYIDSFINNTTSYIPSWNKEGFKGKWNYIDGVFLNSMIKNYYMTNDSKYKDFIIKYVNYYIDSTGNFLNLKDSTKSGFTTGELDSIEESYILFDLYDLTKDKRYLNAINKTKEYLDLMPLCINNINYSHKTSYLNQIWLDGMYMYVPFLLRYASMYNDSSIEDMIVKQYKYIRDNMFDLDKSLYYHAHDTSKTIFWARSDGNSKSFWLRSIGWFLTSLTDSLEYIKNEDNKTYLTNLLLEGINGIMKYQDSDSKMFYQVVDKKGEGSLVSYEKYLKYLNKSLTKDTYITNYLESSGSAMISYVILKSASLNYIDSSYFKKGKEIFEGIYNHSFYDNKLHDICITAGLGPDSKPYRDSTFEYYLAESVGSNDAKGVGPFIMAYLEYKKVK